MKKSDFNEQMETLKKSRPMSKKDITVLKKMQKNALKKCDEREETGSVALLVFKEGVSFDDRQRIINDLFVMNQKKIKGMSYYELNTMELFEKLHKQVRAFGEGKPISILSEQEQILGALDAEIQEWKIEYILEHCPKDYQENKKYFEGYLHGLTRARKIVAEKRS